MKRPLRILLALVVIGVFCVFALVLFRGGSGAVLPMPNPNGYDDFVKAGRLITDSTNQPYDMERDELRAYLLTNAESLRLARLGLSRTSAVPVATAMTNFMEDLMAIKALAHLLHGEGRLAEMDGQTNVAAKCYVDSIRLGNDASRGGFLIHRLVGIACMALSCQALAQLVPTLSCEAGKPVIAELERVDLTGVTWEEVRQAERAFMRHELFQRFNPVAWVQGWWAARASFKSTKQKHDRACVHVRLLATELALRCFHSDQGHPPTRLDELVPKYLKSIPLDPFSGQPLVYRAQGTNWLLYSVGPDRVDDGGTPVGPRQRGSAERKGDWFFDSPW